MSHARSGALKALIGAALGLLVSAIDGWLLSALGVTIALGEHDAFAPAVGVFALTACSLGAAVGWLVESRAKIRDQSDHILTQLAQLRAAQHALAQEASLAAVGRLAAGVAHEVRNPLGVIRASAGLLMQDVPPGSEGADAARFIEEEVDRLDDFITRLMALTRPLTPQLIAAPAREVAQLAANRWPALPVQIDDPDDAALRLDVELTARALLALLRNASEASATRALIRCTPAGFSVVDDGPGLDPTVDEDALFAPFYTTRAQGTGLGLAMVKKLVEVQRARCTTRRGAGLGPGGRGACFDINFEQDKP